MLSWFFEGLFYYLAVMALIAGLALYGVSYFAKLLPVIAAYAMMMQIGGIVLTIGGGYFVADHKGYERRVAEDKAEIDRLNAEARAKEAELAKTLKDKTAALRKAANAISQKQASINKRIDSGELRFPSSCGVSASSDAGAAGGNTTNESDTERQAIKDLIAIAAEGDAAIIQLNSCIANYNSVRETVNAGVK